METARKWRATGDRIAVLRRHLRGKGSEAIAAAASLDMGPVDLPGPTGEANSLLLAPRGTVLCLGPEGETLLLQVIQALAAGNSVIAAAAGARDELRPLADKGLPLGILDGTLSHEALRTMEIDGVAAKGSEPWLREIRRALAARQGAVIPLISEVIYPAAYCHERAICVDTTAAGGNASLLAAS